MNTERGSASRALPPTRSVRPDRHLNDGSCKTLASGTGSRLRVLTLLIFVTSTAGSMLDLVLLGHFEDARQWAPLLLLPAGLLTLAWHRIERGCLGTRAFQGAMVLFIVSGVAGVWLHYRGNAEFELQISPAMNGWRVVREALSGPAPALAPATMVQLGLLGLTYTYRHPFLERRSSRSGSAGARSGGRRVGGGGRRTGRAARATRTRAPRPATE